MAKWGKGTLSSQTYNTRLYFLYLLTLLLYWSFLIPSLTENVILYIFSSAVLVFMTISYFSQIASRHVISNEDFRLLSYFSFFILVHWMFSKTNVFQAVNILFLFYLYIILPKIDINTSTIYKVISYGFVLMSFVLLPQVINGIISTEEYSGFSGIFDSANSIGPLGGCALLSYLLEKKEAESFSKKHYLIIFFILLVIYSSHQRSALLMLFCWYGLYYLLKRNINKKVIFIGFLFLLSLVGSFMVINEVVNENDTSEVQLFGKEASSRGRSIQIYYALNSFDITPFGAGRGTVNKAVAEETNYSVHNTFVASLLEYGYVIFFFYLYFLYSIFKKANIIAAAFILSYHVIMFFEPDTFFSNRMIPFIAFSIILLCKKRETYNEIPVNIVKYEKENLTKI